MKRDYSDMDSESDDVFGEDSKGTPSQSNDSCQMLNRKRRRGIIEKRRRDRINNSLTELRRLVPAAFEKQGSAKLEKAEILQLTVDHLKMLHAKGFDALSFDPHKFAMDYHTIGFRECASEVARYLVAMEGMDLQDPLRLRLMSHLQCYSAQRELAMKSPTSTVHNHWNPPPPPSFAPIAPPPPPPPAAPTPQYPSAPPMGGHIPSTNLGSTVSLPTDNSLSTGVPLYSCAEPRLSGHGGPLDNNGPMTTGHYTRMTTTVPSSSASAATMTPSLVSNGSMVPHPPPLPQMAGNQYLSGHGFTSPGYGPPGHFNQHMSSTGRPYRPWGAELAY